MALGFILAIFIFTFFLTLMISDIITGWSE
jgi:hypothetical protein